MDGQDITRCSHVPAGTQLRHQLSAAGALSLSQTECGRKHHGGAGSAADYVAGTTRKRDQLIDELGLGHIVTTWAMRFPGVSGAVEIARALCIAPKFILLDEPFSGIDPIAVLDLQKIIFDLKGSGIGVLITDHNVRETLSVTDRAYIINEGRIFRTGTPEQLGNDPEVKTGVSGRKLLIRLIVAGKKRSIVELRRYSFGPRSIILK